MKILFAASEAVPFCKTGGLADVAGSLPQALAKAGNEVAVILPLSPDKGSCLHYDPSLPASAFLQNDLKMLLRMRNVLE